MCIGGPALVYYVTPSEEELFSVSQHLQTTPQHDYKKLTTLQRYNPELQKRSLERRQEKQEDFDNFVGRLKEYSKSEKPSKSLPYPTPTTPDKNIRLITQQYGLHGRRTSKGDEQSTPPSKCRRSEPKSPPPRRCDKRSRARSSSPSHSLSSVIPLYHMMNAVLKEECGMPPPYLSSVQLIAESIATLKRHDHDHPDNAIPSSELEEAPAEETLSCSRVCPAVAAELRSQIFLQAVEEPARSREGVLHVVEVLAVILYLAGRDV